MKKSTFKLLLCAAAVASAFPASAKYHSLSVVLADESSVDIDLADDLVVRFNDLEMTVMGSTLSRTVIIPKEDIVEFKHNTTPLAAIDDIGADNAAPVVADGALTFSNLPAGTAMVVFDMAGRQVKALTLNGGAYTLQLSDLSAGTYLVNVNGITYKIAVK